MKNLLILLVSILATFANAQVQFEIRDYDASTGDIIEIPIYVSNFQDIVGAEFMLSWDDTVLDSISASFHPNIAGSNPDFVGRKFLWADDDNACQSIPNGEAIMTMTFQVIGAIGDTKDIFIDDNQIIQVVDCNTFQALPFTTLPGSISVVAPPPSSGSRYGLAVDTTFCDELDLSAGQPKICLPLLANDPVAPGIIGMDFCLDYDESLMSPTGNATLGSVVLNGSTMADYYLNDITDPGKVHVSIYYTAQANNAEFIGGGEIICLEFLLNGSVTTGTTADFELCDGTVQEGYQLQVIDEAADAGSWTLLDDQILEGRVVFWDDENRPLPYDEASTNDYLITNISGMDNACNNQVLSSVPDLNGYFEYDVDNGAYLYLERDIEGDQNGGSCPTNVMPFINGLDCYWTGLVTTFNNTFVPNPYQMLAMDVNMDDRVAANDITLMQERMLQNICEFPQAWNYPAATQRSKDWRFVDQYSVDNNLDFTVSNAYPSNDGSGYHRSNVPDLGNCLEVQTSNNGVCNYIDSMAYSAILLGDVNGNWNSATPNNIRQENNDNVLFGFCSGGSTIRIPVMIESVDPLLSLDFILDYDKSRLEFGGIPCHNFQTEMGTAWNNQNGERLVFTSYSKVAGGLPTNEPVFSLVFHSKDGSPIQESDLGQVISYFNGNEIPTNYDCNVPDIDEGKCVVSVTDLLESSISVYPSIVSDYLTVNLGKTTISHRDIIFFDVQGRRLAPESKSSGNSIQVDLRHLPAGIYFLRIGSITKKVVKQ